MLLGRNELYRWLTVMLVQFADQRKAGSALQEVALWRSRLLELMAVHQGEPVPGQFFTLGLASMLGLLLKITPQEVVDTLGLPPLAQEAVLTQSGAWFQYLCVAAHIEELTLDDIPQWVQQFGGPEALLAMSDEAWVWAAQHTEHPEK
jgi:EAL and modified HD-GYP domain-containing signal transduction protein